MQRDFCCSVSNNHLFPELRRQLPRNSQCCRLTTKGSQVVEFAYLNTSNIKLYSGAYIDQSEYITLTVQNEVTHAVKLEIVARNEIEKLAPSLPPLLL